MAELSAMKSKIPHELTAAERAIADHIVGHVVRAEQLIAAFALDAPVPIRLLYGVYGARSTFHVWKGAGLDVKHIEGMGPSVVPSRLRAFLFSKRGETDPPGGVARVEAAAASASSAAEKAG